MRITCPTCSTQYEVDANDISTTGQDVQCSECMTIWTQARNGDASNPRTAGKLATDAEEIVPDHIPEETTDTDEPEVQDAIPEASESELEEPATEKIEDDAVEESAAEEADKPEEDAPDSEETSKADDKDENPIWKEIAALAKESTTDTTDDAATTGDYTPPKEIPPIQSAPATAEDTASTFEAPVEDDRPWEAVAEAEKEGFSDFVWNDPSKEDQPDPIDVDDAKETEFTALPDTSGGPLEEMGEDLIAAALSEQMAVEDALEQDPHKDSRDVTDIPIELGGPRNRTPNVEALKRSVRSKTVKLTKDEAQEAVPARRFRRGFTLILLIFVILAAVYISRVQITEYLPAVGPYLETYASYVDKLRVLAEDLFAQVWELLQQGYDWVKAKIQA
ncbi:MAG: zinc-ribbon domain-containing protein [Paracoccaceae bacterium]